MWYAYFLLSIACQTYVARIIITLRNDKKIRDIDVIGTPTNYVIDIWWRAGAHVCRKGAGACLKISDNRQQQRKEAVQPQHPSPRHAVTTHLPKVWSLSVITFLHTQQYLNEFVVLIMATLETSPLLPSQASEHTPVSKPFDLLGSTRYLLLGSWINVLLICVPLSFAGEWIVEDRLRSYVYWSRDLGIAEAFAWSAAARFTTSFLAIVPLAKVR